MLFEPSLCNKIIEKYKNTPVPHIPKIISYLTSDMNSGEMDYLEKLFKMAPENIKIKWRNELISDNNGKHIGTWFEIMLYGWLKEFSDVTIEPDINGMHPDFLINLNDEDIIIEAKAILIEEKLRQQDALFGAIFSALHKIEKSYIVRITEQVLKTLPNILEFINEVNTWLDTSPNDEFIYKDNKGNLIKLRIINQSNLKNLSVINNASVSFINPEPLKNPLMKKAKKYSALKKLNYPYIIAIYLESMMFSADDVKNALFGNEKITIDLKTKKVLNSTIDLSGIHYYKDKILHKSVNGTLVFTSSYNAKGKRRFLKAKFIQNPYCVKRIDYSNFPVGSSFIIKNEINSKYEMGWTIGHND